MDGHRVRNECFLKIRNMCTMGLMTDGLASSAALTPLGDNLIDGRTDGSYFVAVVRSFQKMLLHFQPCHSKSIKHHGQHFFNFDRATGAASTPRQQPGGGIEDELDAFRMMEPMDQMADLVDVSSASCPICSWTRLGLRVTLSSRVGFG